MCRDSYDLTPLHYASEMGHVEAVLSLLVAGAHLEARNRGNNTPLLLAALNQHPNTLRVLLCAGANAMCQGFDDGMTPLHIAAMYGHVGIAHILLLENVFTAIHIVQEGNDDGTIITCGGCGSSSPPRSSYLHLPLLTHGVACDVYLKPGYSNPLQNAALKPEDTVRFLLSVEMLFTVTFGIQL